TTASPSSRGGCWTSRGRRRARSASSAPAPAGCAWRSWVRRSGGPRRVTRLPALPAYTWSPSLNDRPRAQSLLTRTPSPGPDPPHDRDPAHRDRGLHPHLYVRPLRGHGGPEAPWRALDGAVADLCAPAPPPRGPAHGREGPREGPE